MSMQALCHMFWVELADIEYLLNISLTGVFSWCLQNPRTVLAVFALFYMIHVSVLTPHLVLPVAKIYIPHIDRRIDAALHLIPA
jgi:hypothetical protein